MRFSTKLRCAVASVAMLAAAPAAAQTVDRIVAFGDSYADDGNLWQLLGIPPLPIYPNGRFSNGTNFVDTMAQILDVPVDNFAIGGALTNNSNVNGAGIPGFVTEYQSFLAGGGPAAFPRVSGTFDADDLAVISIGGNDARAYQQGGGTLAGASAAGSVSAAAATVGINALVGAGAQNITFLAGDAGRLPEVVGTPGAPIRTAFSNSFNTAIQASLANVAAQGVTVNYLDLGLIGNQVEANLAAFNLVSAGACPTTCVTGDFASLDRYLFYVDNLHLTSAGFAIVGRYAVRQLEAPLTFEAQSELVLSSAANFGQMMSGRLDLAGGDLENPLSFYLVGTGATHDADASSNSLAYDYDSFGVSAGAEYSLGMGVIGAAVAYSRPKTDFSAGRSRGDAWYVGAYGKVEMGGAFGEAYAGYGWLDFDIRRRAVIDDISAETDGTGFVVGGEVGYLFDWAGIQVGPVGGLQYVRAELEGYTESGDPVLTLNVGEQRVSELIGFAGVEADIETDIGGLAVKPYAKLLAEKQIDGSRRAISYANTASPTIVNSFEGSDSEDEIYGRVEGGVSFDVARGVALQAQASATFAHEDEEEFSGFLGVRVGF